MSPRPSAHEQHIQVSVVSNALADMRKVEGRVGEFVVIAKFRADADDRMVMRSLEVRSSAAGQEVTPTALRRIELARFVTECRRALARQDMMIAGIPDVARRLLGREQTVVPDSYIGQARRRIKAASRARTATRDDFYRRVALDLIEVAEGNRPLPAGGALELLAQVEAKRLDRPVPVQTLRTWIKVARERGFLAPGERGRLVALPGPHLYTNGTDNDG